MNQEGPPPSDKKSGFPEQLRVILGKSFPCTGCEQRFTVQELKQNGKKSRTWILGTATWGAKDPQMCEVFILKCPNCGDPCQIIVTSRAQSIAALQQKVEPQRKEEVPPKKALPPSPAPKAPESKPLKGPPRFERKKFDPKLEE